VILCCRIPDIPIAALILQHGDDAALRHRPLVVGGFPSERKPVRAASPEARSYGVCIGMPLRQAEQLCPEALFFAVDAKAEADLARHLLAGLYALAPKVELAEGGEAYVDVDGLGDPAAFAGRVGAYLHRRLRSRPALGLGANKFVAATAAMLAAARATTVGEPALMLAPRGSERSFLAPLSLADHLPIGGDMTARLKRFGLRTMADFAAMPLAAVEAQFGKEGLIALRLARGEDSRPLVPWQPPQRMEESSSLDPPVDNLEPLLFVARGLVDRLGTRLVEGGHAATVVRLQLELEDEAAAPEAILRLRASMSTGEELWTPVATLLQRQPVTKPVSRVRLRLTGFCPAASRQMDLLARQDGRLEDISRQLMLLSDAHCPDLVRMAEVAPSPSLLDERRHRWTDPADALVQRTKAGRGRRRPAA
jgi:DNA polymerase-4